MEFIRSQNDSINDLINESINLTDSETRVQEIIKIHSMVNKSETVRIVGKSEATVQRAIRKLISKNHIERVGSRKTGYWKVK